MRYLVNEALLRLIKPLIGLLLATLLYWIITSLLGEAGSALLFLACWISAAAFILLAETGVI
jgi:positive regulator of sigma E activity